MTEQERAIHVQKLMEEAERRIGSFEGVVMRLMEAGDAAFPAVPLLTRMLRHEQDWVRQLAAEGLGQILTCSRAAESLGRHYHQAVAALKKSFETDDWDVVQLHAAIALGNQKETCGGRVVPMLVEALEDGFGFAVYVIEALDRIGVGDPAVAAALVRALGHEKPEARDRAERALRWGGRAAVPALLAGAARGTDAPVREGANRIIRGIGAAAWDALAEAASGPDADLAEHAATLLLEVPEPMPDIRRPAPAVSSKSAVQVLPVRDRVPAGPRGIARMEDAHLLITELQDFYQIGAYYLPRTKGVFSIRVAAGPLDVTPHTAGLRLETVTDFFRRYFKRYGHPPESDPFEAALDEDERAPWTNKIVDRMPRQRPRICDPVGRWAWELTRDFLTGISPLPPAWPEGFDRRGKA